MFTRSRFFLSLIAILAVTLMSAPVGAQQVLRIAAVVNDDIISALDIAQRVRLTIATNRIPDSREVRQRLASTLLRTMIDERLKLQEAERLEISVSEQEIESGVTNFARAQKIPLDRLDVFLQSNGVDKQIIKDQAEAEIAWSRVLPRISRDRIQVSDREVDRAMAEKEANKGKPEYLYAEIYLPIDNPGEEQSVRQMADSLTGHIQNGSPFPSLARDFSQSPTAQKGGVAGWVQSGHIDPALEEALAKMNEGAYSKPIRTPSGYYLLHLLKKRITGQDKKDELLDIGQIILPVKADAPDDVWAAKQQQANTIARQIQSCEHIPELAKQIENANGGLLNDLKLSSMPADIRNTIKPLRKNQITTLVKKEGAVLILMMCERAPLPTKPEIAIRREVKQQLRIEKIGRESRRVLQQLRRSAFVDIRL